MEEESGGGKGTGGSGALSVLLLADSVLLQMWTALVALVTLLKGCVL